MSHSRFNPISGRAAPPLVELLTELVVPFFEEEADRTDQGLAVELTAPDGGSSEVPCVQGRLRGKHLVHVAAFPVDELRTNLRLSMLVGYLIADFPPDVILIGNLFDSTPFHVRADLSLGVYGRLSVGCDLVVRGDDHELVRRRLGELLELGDDLEWFLPLRLPHCLGWREVSGLEVEWEELPQQALEEYLDGGLIAPPGERTPFTLLRLAQGLGRWEDVLQLLQEHPDEFPRRDVAPLKCLALRELKRWMPAIRAARQGGIRQGRYPGIGRLSPSYMHCLIEGGDEIEALRLLAKPVPGEPGYYDWLRGLALHRAGDPDQAQEVFARYVNRYPGDVLAIAGMEVLESDD